MEINGNKKMPVESVDKMSTKNHKVSSIVETLDFKQFLSHRSSEIIFNEVAFSVVLPMAKLLCVRRMSFRYAIKQPKIK